MSVQDTYKNRMDAARPGMVSGSDYNAITGNTETAAGIGFGLAVGQGVADKGIVLGLGAGFRGISWRDVGIGPSQDLYKQNQNIGVITRGLVWVTAQDDVGPGDPVAFDAATGLFGATGGQVITTARWVTSAVAYEVALVELLGRNL